MEGAHEISQRMVGVVRLKDGALLLKADHNWAEAICAVLQTRGVKVKEIRKQSTAAAERLIA